MDPSFSPAADPLGGAMQRCAPGYWPKAWVIIRWGWIRGNGARDTEVHECFNIPRTISTNMFAGENVVERFVFLYHVDI